jgi:hypothetical protein
MPKAKNTGTVLHRLIAEMEDLANHAVVEHEPQAPVARNEAIIGEMPKALQHMHALSCIKKDAVRALAEEQEAVQAATNDDSHLDADKGEMRRLFDQAQPLADDIEVLDRLFWRSIKEQLAVDPDAISTGIRAGWQVVDIYGKKGDVPSSLQSMLGSFLSED